MERTLFECLLQFQNRIQGETNVVTLIWDIAASSR